MDGIVLLAKQPGLTSFASLNNVKKALNTKKVGHTGTLDSFAQGLLVVCCGRLTRLAGNITEFDKSYKAVIKFGTETDTLEYTGKIIKQTSLPTKEKLYDAIEHFTGEQLQKPPVFSAIHIDGKRASDLARNGVEAQIPERKINVYSAKLEDILTNENNEVIACQINFNVSKGTYIRSLARDIGEYTGSSAHLVGLYRTKVGNFKIEDSAGYRLLEEFNIKNCLLNAEKYINYNSDKKSENNQQIKDEILQTLKRFTKDISIECGFYNIDLVDDESLNHFCNGKPIRNKLFQQNIKEISIGTICAVFYKDNFYGIVEKKTSDYECGKLVYKFVNN